MKINKISVKSLFAIAFIFACTTIAWFILGETLSQRTSQHCKTSGTSVEQIWGPIQKQVHPLAWYQSPTGKQGKSYIQPESSNINVDLSYEPKRKGLLWHRTYLTSFSGNYKIPNPTPIAQTIYITFPLPAENTSFHKFSFKLGGNDNSNQTPKNGFITQAITIPANASVPLEVSYQSRGTGKWEYSLGTINRVRNFHLRMLTNFNDIDFPEGSSSPSKRTSNPDNNGWILDWDFPDVIHPQQIGMDMPKINRDGHAKDSQRWTGCSSHQLFCSDIPTLLLCCSIDPWSHERNPSSSGKLLFPLSRILCLSALIRLSGRPPSPAPIIPNRFDGFAHPCYWIHPSSRRKRSLENRPPRSDSLPRTL